jgi:hypothetical protein
MTYPERQYALDVYVSTISIADELTNVVRPLQITFEIEDDFTRVLSGELTSEYLTKLNEGVGYTANPYNNPQKQFDAQGNIINKAERVQQFPESTGRGPLP